MGAALTNIDSIDGVALPAGFGGGLIIPGSLVRPPSIAGGGWSIVNNNLGPGAAVAVDAPYGIQVTLPDVAFAANCGLVRALSVSPTASVEVGATAINNRTLGDSGPQQMLWGAFMYESATGKYLAWQVFNFIDAPGDLRNGLYLVGTDVAGITVGGAFPAYAQPFVRMGLDGIGGIVCDFSVDRFGYYTTQPATPVLTAFTVGPDMYGTILSHPLSGGAMKLSLFDMAFT
jgi:hypothetical protein